MTTPALPPSKQVELPWVIDDAFGRSVRLINPVRITPDALAAFQMDRAQFKALRDESSPLSRRRRLGLTLAPFAFSMMYTEHAVERFIDRRWISFAVIGSVALAFAVAAFIALRFRSGCTPALFVRAMLRRRRCPACAYDLANIPPDAERITTCLECGAAWRLDAPDSPTATHPPADATPQR